MTFRGGALILYQLSRTVHGGTFCCNIFYRNSRLINPSSLSLHPKNHPLQFSNLGCWKRTLVDVKGLPILDLSTSVVSTMPTSTICITTTNLPPAYVYQSKVSETESRVCLELFIQEAAGKAYNSRFRFERMSTEPLSASLDRIVLSVNKSFGAKHAKRVKRSEETDAESTECFTISDAQLLECINADDSQAHCVAVPKSKVWGDVFSCSSDTSSNRPLFLRFSGSTEPLTFRIVLNPARILKCRLDTFPMTNCPIVPYVELDNASLTRCEFLWFISQSTSWPSEPCHTGFIFTPRPEHLNCRLRLRVCPRDADGQMGIPYGTMKQWTKYGEPIDCKWPIMAGPEQHFHNQRVKSSERPSDGFRVVSYNVLADMYSSTDAARNIIFRHCPPEYLDQKYRLPLILRELLSYRADVICLQEVDGPVFHNYLKPALDSTCGMDGIYLSKRALIQTADEPPRMELALDVEKGEGCAIFYNRSRFTLLRESHILSLMTYADQDPILNKVLQQNVVKEEKQKNTPEVFAIDHETKCLKSYAQGLMTALLRFKTDQSNSSSPSETLSEHLLVVGNTHFYFHPTADNLRYVQARVVRHHLNKIAVAASEEFGLPVSILFCGDINQPPEGPAYQALLEQEEMSSNLPVSLDLKSAYPRNSDFFTNWVPGFSAPLDVIMYSAFTGLSCLQTLPLCSQKEISEFLCQNASGKPVCRGEPVSENDIYALPNAQFPSDHISLVADFKWTSTNGSGSE